MSYFSQTELEELGFKSLGKDVKISRRAAIYNCDQISIGDNSRIDDFCVVSGKVEIGRNVHLTIYSHLAGGEPGITLGDFSTFAYGAQAFTQSDDYLGTSMTNSTIPRKYKKETFERVSIGRHCIIGTRSSIFPGVTIQEGTSIGAMSLVTKSTEAWSVYVGVPARRIKARSKELLEIEKQYLAEQD